MEKEWLKAWIADRGPWMRKYINERNCCDGWAYPIDEVDGLCQDCGWPTVDGEAASGCYWSPLSCSTCGHKQCDGSC